MHVMLKLNLIVIMKLFFPVYMEEEQDISDATLVYVEDLAEGKCRWYQRGVFKGEAV